GEESLLAWGQRLLPEHFSRESSKMHLWLSERLAEFRHARGKKLNVIGPRGGAKSTIATLTFILRAALEAEEPYIWLVSDTKHHAITHLDNLRAELTENPRLADSYPDTAGEGPVWRSAAIVLRNGVTIEAYGTGQRIRGRRRRANRPTLIVADDIQNDSHMN